MHEELEEKLIAVGSISSGSEELRRELLVFLLTFNIFENEFFLEPRWNEKLDKKDKNIPSVSKRCQSIQNYMNENVSFMSDSVEEFRKYFKERYMDKVPYSESYKWNDKGKSLRSTKKNPDGYDDDLFEKLRKFFVAETGKNEAISMALSLCYHFRNNLFHGGKDIMKLEDFTGCFMVISKFMAELMKELNRIGFDRAWFPEDKIN